MKHSVEWRKLLADALRLEEVTCEMTQDGFTVIWPDGLVAGFDASSSRRAHYLNKWLRDAAVKRAAMMSFDSQGDG